MIDLAKVPHELFAPILAGNLREVGPSRKLIAHFLEAVKRRLHADACWLTRAGQGERLLPGGRLFCGDAALCDEGLAAAFLRREHPTVPAGVVLSSLVAHGRVVAVVGAARRHGELGQAARRALERLCGVLAIELARREEERLTRVLDRIREKIVSELRPRDLAYQILDGLHQLVDYDHSSAFLAYDRARGVFRIEAEKIVWTKAKSPFVGREIRLPAERIGRICRAIEVRTVSGGGWISAAGAANPEKAEAIDEAAEAIGEMAEAIGEMAEAAEQGAEVIEEAAEIAAEPAGAPGDPGATGLGDSFGDLLDYHRGAGVPPVTSLLAAPLFYGEEFLGILKVAAWQRPPFGRRDRAVVERFLPAAAVSMRNAQVNKSLEMQAVEAEVKASLVTLSHAVAHDVNNAVGSILPLAQQMRFDLRHGPFEVETLDRDLVSIIDNARLCQRIFSNMLRVAGSGRASELPVDAAQVVAETMPFLLALAARRGIEIVLDLAPDLPSVSFRRQDLQHIVLNLVRNSLEALAQGSAGQGGAAGQAAPSLRPGPTGRAAAGGHDAGGGERAGLVEIALRRGDAGTVELAVTDDGPGIPAELLSKVQEPFFSTRPGGTGLGLAICRALAWQNGGSLLVESPIGAVPEPASGPAPGPVLELAPEPAMAEAPVAAAAATAPSWPEVGAAAEPPWFAAGAGAEPAWRTATPPPPLPPATAVGGTRVTLRLGAEARSRESA